MSSCCIWSLLLKIFISHKHHPHSNKRGEFDDFWQSHSPFWRQKKKKKGVYVFITPYEIYNILSIFLLTPTEDSFTGLSLSSRFLSHTHSNKRGESTTFYNHILHFGAKKKRKNTTYSQFFSWPTEDSFTGSVSLSPQDFYLTHTPTRELDKKLTILHFGAKK